MAVVGIGFLGALLARLCWRAGARVLAISRRPFALDLARRFGAAETIALGGGDEVARVMDLTHGRGCERVIEAVGRQSTLDLASETHRASAAASSSPATTRTAPRQVDMQLWNWRGLDVVNAHERDPLVYLRGMHAALAAVLEGWLDPRPLLHAHVPPRRPRPRARRRRRTPDGFVKGLLVP